MMSLTQKTVHVNNMNVLAEKKHVNHMNRFKISLVAKTQNEY